MRYGLIIRFLKLPTTCQQLTGSIASRVPSAAILDGVRFENKVLEFKFVSEQPILPPVQEGLPFESVDI